MNITPLPVKSNLAGTPSTPPVYKTEVKNINGEDDILADPRATRTLLLLMNQHAVIGGAACHWGGPSAFAEIMSSIHCIMFKKSKWYDNYNFVNDAGHTENGIYALRANYGFGSLNFESLKKFRSIKSHLTGHGEAHLNKEGVDISNGPLGSGISQAQGLAMADKITDNSRITICTISDGGSMEGEAKEAFASIPGLHRKNKINPFILIISDNNTKLSGRIDQDSFTMGPTFESLKILGWDIIVCENGNNLQNVHNTIEEAIKNIKTSKKPIALIFKTIKGYGIKLTEDSPSGGHGYPLKAYDERLIELIKEVYKNKEVPEFFLNWAEDILKDQTSNKQNTNKNEIPVEKVQAGFSKAAIKAVKNKYPVFSISSDLQGSTGIASFQKKYPNNFIDLGVAEANMISTAIGLSKKGLIPIVDTFSQFGITKGNLPLIMSSLSEGPIIALFSHTGFQDAADGASHQATTYISSVSSIPNVKVIVCACSTEAEIFLYKTIEEFKLKRERNEIPYTTIFFVGRENFPIHFGKHKDTPHDIAFNSIQVIRKGSDISLIACGPMLNKAILASDILLKKGISCTIINNPFVNNPDVEQIAKEIENTNSKAITIEDHQIIGGMGSILIHALIQKNYQLDITTLGTNGKFGQSAYTANDLYEKHNLDEESIVKAAIAKIEKY